MQWIILADDDDAHDDPPCNFVYLVTMDSVALTCSKNRFIRYFRRRRVLFRSELRASRTYHHEHLRTKRNSVRSAHCRYPQPIAIRRRSAARRICPMVLRQYRKRLLARFWKNRRLSAARKYTWNSSERYDTSYNSRCNTVVNVCS